jgi:hypothetical protein
VNEIRTFLKIDCTQICRFQADGRRQVLVESSPEQAVRVQLKIPQCGAEVPSPVLELLSPTPMTLTVLVPPYFVCDEEMRGRLPLREEAIRKLRNQSSW